MNGPRLRALAAALIPLASLALVHLPVPAGAQTGPDDAGPVLAPGTAAAVVALIGRGLREPARARYGPLRQGRAGIVCGTVDQPNRMGDYTGARRFVADPAAGFAEIVPDAPELRHPASPARYAAMRRALDLAAHCTGD